MIIQTYKIPPKIAPKIVSIINASIFIICENKSINKKLNYCNYSSYCKHFSKIFYFQLLKGRLIKTIKEPIVSGVI